MEQVPPFVIIAIGFWTIIWKGLALWRSAKSEQRNWFIAMLIINTVGILEIVYLFAFAKNKLTLEQIKSFSPFTTAKSKG